MPSTNRVRILTKIDDVEALRPQWDALWRRCDGNYRLTSTVCLAAWKQIMVPLGASLHVVVCFEGDELAAIWPLVRRRQLLWRVLLQLGPISPEFSDILVEDSPRADAHVAAIWQHVLASIGADLIMLPSVKATTRLGALLAKDRRMATRVPDPAPYAAWNPSESWDSYFASLASPIRNELNRKKRRLHSMGDLRFETVKGPERMPGLLQWLLREKRVWSNRTGKQGAWLYSDANGRFLEAVATGQGSQATFLMFLLSLDGEPIAASFAMEGAHHMESIIGSFSSRLAPRSPGLVLSEYFVRHAFDRRLGIEFGVGNEPNKRFWGRGEAHTTVSYRMALTPWGAASLAMLLARNAIRTKLAQRTKISHPVQLPTD